MHDKPPIEGQFWVVGEEPVPEPIIKSWRNLAYFIAPLAASFVVQYARVKGWL